MPGARDDLKAALDKAAQERGVTLPAQVREIMAANADKHIRELVNGYRGRTRWMREQDIGRVTSSLKPAPRKKPCGFRLFEPEFSGYRMPVIVLKEGEELPGRSQTRRKRP